MPDESIYIEMKVFYLHFLRLAEIIRISLFSSQSAAKAHANQTTAALVCLVCSRVFLFFFFYTKHEKVSFSPDDVASSTADVDMLQIIIENYEGSP